MRKVILFELNEVPLRIIDWYCQISPQSNLARHMSRFMVHETISQDEGHLSPWKTWPSLHRGTTDHGLHDLGQVSHELDAQFPPIWKVLISSGVSTGVFGSLHSYPLPANAVDYEFFVPDVFAGSPEVHPASVEPLQALSLAMARSSGRNVSTSFPIGLALHFLQNLRKVGIRARTMFGLAKQLVEERVRRMTAVRRRTWQSVLAFDAYLHLLNRTKPQFSTFFTNHVASSMHRYWAATFPGDYDTPLFDEKWAATYAHEIEFAMKKADEMIGSLLSFAERNADFQVWITSSMGQHAVDNGPLETQLWITKPERFFALLGLHDGEWQQRPAMFPQFNLAVGEDKVADFESALKDVRINGEPIAYRKAEGGFFSLDFGQGNLQEIIVTIDASAVHDTGLANIQIEDRSNSSAYHIPSGSLLIFDPVGNGGRGDPISTLEIAPRILRNFNVQVPSYMRGAAQRGEVLRSFAATHE